MPPGSQTWEQTPTGAQPCSHASTCIPIPPPRTGPSALRSSCARPAQPVCRPSPSPTTTPWRACPRPGPRPRASASSWCQAASCPWNTPGCPRTCWPCSWEILPGPWPVNWTGSSWRAAAATSAWSRSCAPWACTCTWRTWPGTQAGWWAARTSPRPCWPPGWSRPLTRPSGASWARAAWPTSPRRSSPPGRPSTPCTPTAAWPSWPTPACSPCSRATWRPSSGT